MVRQIRHLTGRGTSNRYQGKLDYKLPSPWNVGNTTNYTASQYILADLGATDTAIPIEIDNTSGTGQGDDDDDGNPYDVLFWQVDENENIGFNQEIYIFREPVVNATRIENIPISENSSIKEVAIIIEDYNSNPVRQGISTGRPTAETDSDDFVVYTTASNDVIFGLSGNDTLFSNAGNDLVNGGSGVDRIVGNSGDDQLYGEAGDDTVQGLGGRDTIYGGAGNDAVYGGSDDDAVYGGTGDDKLNGDAGSDTLVGGTGNDTYVVTIDTSDTIVELADQGIDIVDSEFSYTLPANVERLILRGGNAVTGIGNDLDNVITEADIAFVDSTKNPPAVDNIIQAGNGNDIVKTDTGKDTLDGGAGNDSLAGGQDTDRLTGGAGADRFVFDDADSVDVITDFNPTEGDKLVIPIGEFVSNNLAIGTLPAAQFYVGTQATTDAQRFIYNPATGALFFDSDGTAVSNPIIGVSYLQRQIATLPTNLALANSDIEVIDSYGLSISDVPNSTPTAIAGTVLTGTAGNDRQFGTEGNDTINTLAGDDIASGQEGNDSINGGNGKDFLEGGSGNDVVLGEAGSDQLYGEAGSDTLNGGSENDTLNGGSENDTLTGGAAADRFNFYNPATGGIDQIIDFNVAEDEIGIYVGEKAISGFSNAGLTPNSPITAAQFNLGTAAADGNDRFIYNSVTGALFFDADGNGAAAQTQIATLSSGLALTNKNLLAFDDTNINAPESATAGNDTLNGNANNNNISGMNGNDVISGNEGNDTLNGGAGNDSLKGGTANDILLGLGGNDVLSGGDGKDRLEGGNGKDKLFSGLGNDTLKGGKGKDIFVLEKGAGRDRIVDFQNGLDRLGLTPGLRSRKLTFAQKANSTLIRQGKDDLALLIGIQPNQLTATDFVSVKALI